MLKNIYFELLLVLILTSAALGRIVYPDMREKEIKENPFMNDYISYGIIIFELLSLYFILSNTLLRPFDLVVFE